MEQPDAQGLQLVPLVGGFVLGLAGWTLYWLGLPAIGAIAGAGGGGSLGYFISTYVEAAWAFHVFTGLGMVLGAVFGFMFVRTMQKLLFFIVGAFVGGGLAWRAVSSDLLDGLIAEPNSIGGLLTVAVGALVGGLALLRVRRYVVAIVTAVFGAVLVSTGVPAGLEAPALAVTLVVFLAVQVGLVNRFISAEDYERRTRRDLDEDEG